MAIFENNADLRVYLIVFTTELYYVHVYSKNICAFFERAKVNL